MELTLLALQDVMLSAMTENLSLSETMHTLCREVQRIAPEIIVSTLRLDSERVMRPLAAPGLPSAYDAAVDGARVGPGMGTCGPAMTCGQPVFSRDIRQDPNWRPLAHVIEEAGIFSCWSHPIKHQNGRVLGSLAFYFTQPGEPNEFHARLAQACVRLCELAFKYEEKHDGLLRFANLDTLTALPNRGMLEREAERFIEQMHRQSGMGAAVLMIDVDHLRHRTDTDSQTATDKALRMVANCIAESLPRPDDIASRYGNDEFCVLLKDVELREANEVAESIRRLVEEGLSASVTGLPRDLTVSIGVSTFDADVDESFEDLIDRADQCVYIAKRMGRNKVIAPQPSLWKEAQGATQNPGLLDFEEFGQLYGANLAPQMGALTDAIKPVVRTIIEEVVQHLSGLTGAGKLIRCMETSELHQWKMQQMRNLLLVASPRLTAERHHAVSQRWGRTHAILGLGSRDLAHSREILQIVVSRHVDATAHHAALATLSRRLTRDVVWQIEALRRTLDNAQEVLLRTTELAWNATSHADLIGNAAAILGTLDGSAGCSFGRPGAEDVFRFESVAGERLKGYLADLESSSTSVIMKGTQSQGQGPTGRAWIGGHVERCINVETDHRMGPWRRIARRHGIRSSVAIPLCPPDRAPNTVLTLYSELPGGFTSAAQVGFIRQIQAVLTFAISRLESGMRTSHALPWATRQRWASLIATPALEMHYQPILDLASGRVVRAEALVRLRDGGEILAPGKFFPCLSHEDFVVVYAQGLRQVLDQQNRWLDEGLDIQVSVNLPAEALHDSRYYEITRDALQQHGRRPRRLMLEVLETSGLASRYNERDCLDNFRALGIALAEDDLGAGHSSLDRLRALPFDVIKLDRSLVLGVEKTPIEVLSSIYQLTHLCHALGKTVVVEGVESADLVEAVALLGADAVQGYAIARPMPAARFFDWMHDPGAIYVRPDRIAPKGYLARLAKLLIWEAHLQLLFGMPQSRIYEVPLQGPPVLPFGAVDSSVQKALVETAMNEGVTSPAYRQARDRLIEALAAI